MCRCVRGFQEFDSLDRVQISAIGLFLGVISAPLHALSLYENMAWALPK